MADREVVGRLAEDYVREPWLPSQAGVSFQVNQGWMFAHPHENGIPPTRAIKLEVQLVCI